MIARHVSMRVVKKSDAAGLIKYITSDHEKNERIGYVKVTNCHQQDPLDAALEIQATQAINTRAESDKTYHLIISFRAGENPDQKTLSEIEERICEGVGFSEHQRVSAVHHDTDNLHIHVAINKIHPTRYTIHTPYNDHKTLGKWCEKLEIEYGLERDNHQPKKRGGENNANDMEAHAGVESLLGWINRECLSEIKAANNWEQLHQVMASNGLEVKEKANGLVFIANDGTAVKASSVDRELSKPSLEKKLGQFRDKSGKAKTSQRRQYEKKPFKARVDTTELYAKYKNDQLNAQHNRSLLWTKAKDDKDRAIAAAKRSAKLKRAVIKLAGNPAITKKLLYQQVSKSLKADIKRINEQYRKKRQDIYNKSQQ